MAYRKKVLLVGTSFSATPIFFELKKRGLHVTACGALKTDPVHQYSDESAYVDYSDRKSLLEVAEAGHYDYLVPTCNDYSYLSASWVAEKLGLPGFDSLEVSEVLHTKSRFRDFTSSQGLKAPEIYEPVRRNYSNIPTPCLVKPVDAFSGKGITRVDSTKHLPAAIEKAENASKLRKCVLEQYVTGTLHSHSAFIRNGKILLDFFVDEFCTVYQYQVNCSNHPSRLRTTLRDAVRQEIQKLAESLRICDGLLHTQFITNESEFWIIECMRRCPGDLYGRLIERSTSVNYTQLFIAPFIEEDYAENVAPAHQLPYGRHTVSTTNEIVYFSSIQHIPTAAVEVIQIKPSGEVLGPAPDDKAAILVFPFQDAESMFELTPRLAEMVRLTTPGGSSG